MKTVEHELGEPSNCRKQKKKEENSGNENIYFIKKV